MTKEIETYEWLKKIKKENLDSSFNLQNILKKSAYYPASGIDGDHFSWLFQKGIYSFVHADYEITHIDELLEKIFDYGYDMIGSKLITSGITNSFFNKSKRGINKHEKERLKKDNVRERYDACCFSPFAFWAVFELDTEFTDDNLHKPKRFSLLHCGGEACAVFNTLYKTNKINPHAVIFVCASEGYGNNWTLLTDSNFRFYKAISDINKNYNQPMPEYILRECCAINWKDYEYQNEHYVRITNNQMNIYIYQNTIKKIINLKCHAHFKI